MERARVVEEHVGAALPRQHALPELASSVGLAQLERFEDDVARPFDVGVAAGIARGADHLPALACEALRARAAYAGGYAGDEDEWHVGPLLRTGER